MALAAPAVWRGAIAQTRQRPTPAQTEGPFYPVELPADSDADLLVQGAAGLLGARALAELDLEAVVGGAQVEGAARDLGLERLVGAAQGPGEG